MSKTLSGIELEVIVSKLMAAKAEIRHLVIEEENVSEAALICGESSRCFRRSS